VSAAHVLILLVAAVAGGLLNAVVGGGTMITFPTLLFLGTPAIVANATNTFAMVPSGLASTIAYRKDVVEPRRNLVLISLCSAAGAAVGAYLLLHTPGATFLHLIPVLLLVATLLFTFGQRILPKPAAAADDASVRLRPIDIALQVVISVYGGYFGGGMGILMLAAFTLRGMRGIHAMNGLRGILTAAINGAAVLFFIAAKAVTWPAGLLMCAGTSAGGFVGAAVARKIDPRLVRVVVIVLAWSMTLYFFYRFR
jgi:uncharacterized membrane protein YfcA